MGAGFSRTSGARGGPRCGRPPTRVEASDRRRHPSPRLRAPPGRPRPRRGRLRRQVEAWLASPSVRTLNEGTKYLPHLSDAVRTARATGGAVHDARIAALCRYHGVRVLWSADRDFSRYPELRVENPLIGRVQLSTSDLAYSYQDTAMPVVQGLPGGS